MIYKYIYTRSEEAKKYLLSQKGYAVADKDVMRDGKVWIFELTNLEYKQIDDLEMKKLQNLGCFVSDKFTMKF